MPTGMSGPASIRVSVIVGFLHNVLDLDA